MVTMQQVQEAQEMITSRIVQKPTVGIILGTGLNELVHHLQHPTTIPYQEIPHFPVSTVSFHQGRLIAGLLNGVSVLVMQGRFHFYEGYFMHQITFPIRVMKKLGIEYLLISNAAGGMNPAFKKGDLIVIEDHINMMPDNPLRGLPETFGEKFIDMSQPYDENLQKLALDIFQQLEIPAKKGVYVSVMGPNLETRAEYRWLRNTGADMVGMSTVPEVIVANQVGIKCAAISVITDECDPENLKPVNIEEIIEIAGNADKKLTAIFLQLVKKISSIFQ